jgi:hypothetical protein
MLTLRVTALGVLGEYAKSLRVLHVRLDSFHVFSDYVKILSAYSQMILCTANKPKVVIFSI